MQTEPTVGDSLYQTIYKELKKKAHYLQRERPVQIETAHLDSSAEKCFGVRVGVYYYRPARRDVKVFGEVMNFPSKRFSRKIWHHSYQSWEEASLAAAVAARAVAELSRNHHEVFEPHPEDIGGSLLARPREQERTIGPSGD